jgi:Na+-driven multidrug efflux pump
LLAAAVGNWAFRVPLAFAFTRLELPLIWMWMALVFDHVARATWVSWSFARGHWRERALARGARTPVA